MVAAVLAEEEPATRRNEVKLEPPPEGECLWEAKHVAYFLRLSYDRTLDLVRNHRLPCIELPPCGKPGKAAKPVLRFRPEDVRKFAASRARVRA